MKAALLPDRGVLGISGVGARAFLNGLLTSDIEGLTPGTARYAALLTPQGKIVVDGIVTMDGETFLIDVPRPLAPTLADKLKFYKLRAKIMIEDRSDTLGVTAVWDGAAAAVDGALLYPDPRLPALGQRLILPPDRVADVTTSIGAALADASDYDSHRIRLGVPRGGMDFIYGDAFPHEADMDQLGGVDFAKGCYIGQEVVSRTEHRGIARTRVVAVELDAHAPEPGLPVMAGDKAIGTTGSASGDRALAMLRLDRLADALAAGTPLIAGGIELRPRKQDWARFAFPDQRPAA